MSIDIDSYIKAQESFCDEHDLPMFMPRDGLCFHCRRDIFDGKFGYSLAFVSSHLVTGCPYCNRSFCD